MKADTSRRSLLHTPVGVVATVSTFGVIAYSAWVFSGYYDNQLDTLLSSIGLVLLNLLVCVFGVLIVLQRDYERTLRWAWFMLTLGALSSTIAEGIRLYSSTILQIEPFPGPADIFYTLYYPLALVGLLIFPLVFVPRKERGILWLDLAIVIMFFGMILWYYFLASPLFSTGQVLGKYWAMIYPVGDFLLLAAIITLIQRDLTRVARWILGFMAFGILFAALANILFAYYELLQIPYQKVYLNMLWLCSVQAQVLASARLIASGPDMLNDPPARFSPLRHLFRLALPYLAIISSLVLLAVIIYTRPDPDRRLIGLMVGAYSIVGLVLLRQYVVLKENVRLYQTMQRVAWTDSLTGLYNRHFFNEVLPRELERTQRYDHQLSVLLIDLDGFKKYNDQYGHLNGDMVLKTVARIFSIQLRSSDTIARFGGDEFVVILPETNRRKATAIAERIGEAVAAHSFQNNRLSVSIGVASYRRGITPEQLLDEADQDMYRKKGTGKNDDLAVKGVAKDLALTTTSE